MGYSQIIPSGSDLIKTANEVPFLITASEKERKNRRRQKHIATGRP